MYISIRYYNKYEVTCNKTEMFARICDDSVVYFQIGLHWNTRIYGILKCLPFHPEKSRFYPGGGNHFSHIMCIHVQTYVLHERFSVCMSVM